MAKGEIAQNDFFFASSIIHEFSSENAFPSSVVVSKNCVEKLVKLNTLEALHKVHKFYNRIFSNWSIQVIQALIYNLFFSWGTNSMN